MGAFSDYLEDAVLDHVLGTAAYAIPTVYLALYTVAPTDSTAGTEVAGGSYARQAISMNAASGGSADNDTAIEFTGMPACTVVAAALHDAVSGGNRLMQDEVADAKAYPAGATARVSIGNLIASLD